MSVSSLSTTDSSQTKGMLFMVLALMLVPVGDTLTKLLTGVLLPLDLAFWRYVFQGVFITIAMLVMKQKFAASHFGLLALGGLTSGLTLLLLIGAFSVMPIATAIAIFFVEPLILTVLSVLLLGEKAGWRRYLAIAVGMCGALIVIRPNWAVFGWQVMLPLFAAFTFAVNMLVVRRIGPAMGALSIQFWFTLFAVALMGASLLGAQVIGIQPWVIPNVSLNIWAVLVLMGLIAAVAFLLLSQAFRMAPASTLAPLQYLEIVGAIILGYVVFGDFPDAMTWLGTGIILLSGIYVFHREQVNRRAAAKGIPRS